MVWLMVCCLQLWEITMGWQEQSWVWRMCLGQFVGNSAMFWRLLEELDWRREIRNRAQRHPARLLLSYRFDFDLCFFLALDTKKFWGPQLETSSFEHISIIHSTTGASDRLWLLHDNDWQRIWRPNQTILLLAQLSWHHYCITAVCARRVVWVS